MNQAFCGKEMLSSTIWLLMEDLMTVYISLSLLLLCECETCHHGVRAAGFSQETSQETLNSFSLAASFSIPGVYLQPSRSETRKTACMACEARGKKSKS